MNWIYDIDGTPLFSNICTPEIYGAVGDGITDDTTSIQQAIDKKGLIIFGTGKTYKVTSTLRIKDHTTLDFNGATINCTHKHLLFNFLNTSTFTGYSGNGDITIRDGVIVGGAISFAHAENILLENVHFKNSLNDHFLEVCGCKNYTIRHSSFTGMVYSTSSVLEYINIDPCLRNPFPWIGNPSSVFYDGTVNDGLTIEGCVFAHGASPYNNGYNAIGIHTTEGNNHNNMYFLGNIISDFTGCGIRLNKMNGVYVADNNIQVVGDGIRIGDVAACSNIVIKDNYVVSHSGTKLVRTNGRYTNLTVANNVTQGDTQEF